jgi:Tfp pilus assembly protein PilN
MTVGTLLTTLLALGALAYVLAPLLRRDALEPHAGRGAALDELRELHARQQMLLASLKELEDDRQTGKIGDEDYERLHARLSAQAIEVMQRLDRAEPQGASRPPAPAGTRQPEGSS